jgi:hypothetical protein
MSILAMAAQPPFSLMDVSLNSLTHTSPQALFVFAFSTPINTPRTSPRLGSPIIE